MRRERGGEAAAAAAAAVAAAAVGVRRVPAMRVPWKARNLQTAKFGEYYVAKERFFQ